MSTPPEQNPWAPGPSPLPSDDPEGTGRRTGDPGREQRVDRDVGEGKRRSKRKGLVTVGVGLLALALVAAGALVMRPWESPDDEEEVAGPAEAGVSNGTEVDPGALPMEARERSTDMEYVTLAEATTEEPAENGSSSGIDRGPWGRFVLDPWPGSAFVNLTGIGGTGAAVSTIVRVSAAEEHTITPEWFSVVTEQGVIRPVEVVGGEDLEDSHGRLIFMDAPERGLIVFASPDHEEGVRGYPPVGLCYDAARSEFSTLYDDCV